MKPSQFATPLPVPNARVIAARRAAAADRVETTPTFLTIIEVAAVMRVSKMTVYRLVHGGELPAVRIGHAFRVNKRALDEYLLGAVVEAS